MPKLTWLGEDELHRNPDGSGAGPSNIVWNGVKFPKDVAVDVSDKGMIAKAKGNKFFKVEGLPGRPPKVSDGDDNGQDQS